MRNKHKNVCTTLNCIQHFLILVFAVTGCISISTFASFVNIAIWIISPAIGLRTFTITAGIKNYKSIIKQNKRSMMK